LATGSSFSGPRWILGVLALVLLAAGCTETDEFVEPVGTTRIVVAAPGLAPQSVNSPEGRIQVAEWSVEAACLDLDGTPVDLVNLTEGCAEGVEACEITDTVYISPYSDTRCAGGVTIGATQTEALDINLALTFTMTVRRARPVDLPSGSDYDGDDFDNEVDNCPLIFNPDQRDDNQDGIGDACAVTVVGGEVLLDSDADGVPDSADNCVWEYNPSQTNTTGVAEKGLNDGIGDACTEQIATVVDATGSSQISLVLGPVGLAQLRSRPSYITVDIDDALICGDWTGDCRLDLGKVRLCAAPDISSAGAGCP
jgi:hypothetical protein